MSLCFYTTSADITVRIAPTHLILLMTFFLFASQGATMKRVCAVAYQNRTEAAQPASTVAKLPTCRQRRWIISFKESKWDNCDSPFWSCSHWWRDISVTEIAISGNHMLLYPCLPLKRFAQPNLGHGSKEAALKPPQQNRKLSALKSNTIPRDSKTFQVPCDDDTHLQGVVSQLRVARAVKSLPLAASCTAHAGDHSWHMTKSILWHQHNNNRGQDLIQAST